MDILVAPIETDGLAGQQRRGIEFGIADHRGELKRLQSQLGIPFIHVTHGQDEALALADLIVVMNKGRIEQAGSAREVFERPATEFVARFLGGHNVIRTPAGLIAVRADRTRLARNGAAGLIDATVTGVEYQGATYSVALEGGGASDLTAIVDDAAFSQHPVAVGDQVGLAWSEADIRPVSPAN